MMHTTIIFFFNCIIDEEITPIRKQSQFVCLPERITDWYEH